MSRAVHTDPNPRADVQLLLDGVRQGLEPKSEPWRLVGRPSSWEALLDLARRHKVAPLLFQGLRTAGADAVPAGVLASLKDECRSSAMKGLGLTGELLKLLDGFTAAGIAAVPYKGPVLAAVAYGDLALRQYVDLDVLIRRRDFAKAKALLVEQSHKPEVQLEGAREAAYLRQNYACGFASPAGGMVEIHWDFVPPCFSFPLADECWGRLTEVTLAGRTVRTLALEDTLLMLSVHGAKHLWRQLNWVADIAALLRRHEEFDWQALRRRAAKFDAVRMVGLAVWLANRLLGAEVPKALIQAVEGDPEVGSLGRQVKERLFRGAAEPSGFAASLTFHLRCRARLSSRLRHCLRLGAWPSPRDLEALNLPAVLQPLYLPLRAARLLSKYGAKPARLWRREAP